MYLCRIVFVLLLLSSGLTALVFAMIAREHATMADDIRATPNLLGEFPHPANHAFGDLLFTPDGMHLVGLGYDQDTRQGVIHFWDMKDRKLVRTLREPDMLAAGAFTPDGKRLVTACWDHRLRIYSGAKWDLEHTFDHDPPRQTANYLAMFPDGKRLLSGNVGFQGPRIWKLEDRSATPLASPRAQVKAVAVGVDGKRFVVAYQGPLAEIWDSDKLEVVGRLHMEVMGGGGRQGVFTSLALGPDGKTIATGCITVGGTNALRIWDAKTFNRLGESEMLAEFPVKIAYTPDSKLVVSNIGPDPHNPGKLHVWEVASGKLVHQFQSAERGGMLSALSPDGRWLVTCSSDGHLRLWDFAKIRKDIGR